MAIRAACSTRTKVQAAERRATRRRQELGEAEKEAWGEAAARREARASTARLVTGVGWCSCGFENVEEIQQGGLVEGSPAAEVGTVTPCIREREGETVSTPEWREEGGIWYSAQSHGYGGRPT